MDLPIAIIVYIWANLPCPCLQELGVNTYETITESRTEHRLLWRPIKNFVQKNTALPTLSSPEPPSSRQAALRCS